MAFFLLLLLCFTAGVRGGQAAAPLAAPSPSVDCSNELVNLVGCLPFVQNGSNATRPDAACCSGLRKVVADSCLCQLVGQSQGQGQALGVNATKALTLPSACGVSNAASNCNTSIAGVPAAAAAAPGHSPSRGAASSAVSGVEFLSSFAVALWLYYQSH